MKEIPLSRGKVAWVDDEDYERLVQWKWHCLKIGYAARTKKEAPNRYMIYMHRLILNAPSNLQVDHINHNTLDNRRCNLRLCTKAEQQYNIQTQRTRKDGKRSSIYKGVSHRFDTRKWVAILYHNGHKVFRHEYLTEIEAAIAYNEQAKKYFGKFACLNQIPEGQLVLSLPHL